MRQFRELKDHELYRRILGIEAPWQVDWVDLKLEAGEGHVRLAHDRMGCRVRNAAPSTTISPSGSGDTWILANIVRS